MKPLILWSYDNKYQKSGIVASKGIFAPIFQLNMTVSVPGVGAEAGARAGVGAGGLCESNSQKCLLTIVIVKVKATVDTYLEVKNNFLIPLFVSSKAW